MYLPSWRLLSYFVVVFGQKEVISFFRVFLPSLAHCKETFKNEFARVILRANKKYFSLI